MTAATTAAPAHAPTPRQLRDLYETLGDHLEPSDRVTRIAAALDWEIPAVYRALRAARLDLDPPPAEVADLYARQHGLSRIAARYGVGWKRIRRTLTGQGIPIRPIGSGPKSRGRAWQPPPAEQLRQLHHDQKRSINALAVHFGVHWETAAAALDTAGVQRRRYPAKPPLPQHQLLLTGEERAYAIRRYGQGAGLGRIGKELGRGGPIVRRTLVAAGIPIRARPSPANRPVLTDQDRRALRATYDTGKPLHITAALHGLSRDHARAELLRAGATIRPSGPQPKPRPTAAAADEEPPHR